MAALNMMMDEMVMAALIRPCCNVRRRVRAMPDMPAFTASRSTT